MKNIIVFCGSSMGKREIYRQVAEETGKQIAHLGHRLVYGGGCLGLMDVVSDATLLAGGEVVGIMPKFFDPVIVGEKKLTRSLIVENLSERKAKMMDLADAFIILPGGLGTLDELYEVLAVTQLNQLAVPIGILNVNGFFDASLAQLNLMVSEGFLQPKHRALLIEATTVEELFQKMNLSV